MKWIIRFVRTGIPLLLIGVIAAPRSSRGARIIATLLLFAFWTAFYTRYRRAGLQRTQWEWEQFRSTNWEAFWRHYNERVPTVEEEFEIWGPYHQHRHEMRYDLVADECRRHLPPGGRLLDLGCGSALVADRLADLPFTYVGADFGGPHIAYAHKKYANRTGPMSTVFVRADAEHLPIDDETIDVVVMSEVIEHLLRPDVAVWEISRILKPGGVFVMTTNNASEVPLRSPLSHMFAWIEKAAGASYPALISNRPWVWPERVDPTVLPEGSPDVYIPHSHHIQAETSRMFDAAGLETIKWSTFEFPPPQSRLAAWFESKGTTGTTLVDVVEAVAQRTPVIRRLGTHVFIISKKTRDPVAAQPPPGLWPGPLSSNSR